MRQRSELARADITTADGYYDVQLAGSAADAEHDTTKSSGIAGERVDVVVAEFDATLGAAKAALGADFEPPPEPSGALRLWRAEVRRGMRTFLEPFDALRSAACSDAAGIEAMHDGLPSHARHYFARATQLLARAGCANARIQRRTGPPTRSLATMPARPPRSLITP